MYGIPETQSTIRKITETSLQSIYQNNNNSVQKNSLIHGTPSSPPSISSGQTGTDVDASLDDINNAIIEALGETGAIALYIARQGFQKIAELGAKIQMWIEDDTGVIGQLYDLGETIINSVTALFQNPNNNDEYGLEFVVPNIIEGVKTALADVVLFINELGEKILEWIQADTGVIGQLYDLGETIINSVTALFQNPNNNDEYGLEFVVPNIIEGIKTSLADVVLFIGQLGAKIQMWIEDDTGIIGQLYDLGETIINSVTALFQNPNNNDEYGLEFVVPNIIESVKTALADVVLFINELGEKILEWIQADTGVIGQLYDLGETIINSVTALFQNPNNNDEYGLEFVVPNIIEGIKTSLADVVLFINELGEKILEWIQADTGVIGQLYDLGESVINSITTLFENPNNNGEYGLEFVVPNIIESVRDLLFGVGGNAITWLEERGTQIKTALGDAYSNLQDWYDTVHSTITEFVNDPSGYVTNLVTAIAVNLKNLFRNDAGVLGAFYEGLFNDNIGENSPVPRNTENNLFKGIGKGVNAVGLFFANVENNVTAVATKILDTVFGVGGNAITWLEERGTQIKTALGDTYNSAVQWVQGLTSTVRTGIIDAGVWVVNSVVNVKNLISSSGRRIKTALGEAYTNLQTWYNTVNSTITEFVNDPSGYVTNLVTAIAVNLKNLFRNDAGVLGAFYEGLFNDNAGENSPVPSNAENNLIKSIGEGLRTSWRGIKRWYDAFNDASRTAVEKVGEFFTGIVEVGRKIKDELFGIGVLPEAFAQKQADTQITSSINSDDETKIGGAIKKEIKTEFDLFKFGLDGIRSIPATIGSTIDGIVLFLNNLTSGMNAGANTSLSNLENVNITTALQFDKTTDNSTDETKRSYGFEQNGNIKITTEQTNAVMRISFGSTANNNTEIDPTGIKFSNYNTTRPGRGEIKRVSTTNNVIPITILANLRAGVTKDFDNIPDALDNSKTLISNSNGKIIGSSVSASSLLHAIHNYPVGETVHDRLESLESGSSTAFGAFLRSIIPNTTKNINLGSSMRLWDNIHTDVLYTNTLAHAEGDSIAINGKIDFSVGSRLSFGSHVLRVNSGIAVGVAPTGYINVRVEGSNIDKRIPYY